jgi:hypothetical protein
MPIKKVIGQIISGNSQLAEFWSRSEGWAPIEASQLLSKSRLDWQVSLSHCLKNWFEPSSEEENDGRLILAWANLGSLVEGTMQLFLSVYYEDYIKDPQKLVKNSKLGDPDTLELERLRVFFNKRIWIEEADWNNWVLHIQHRRNAIHAYKNRDIGDFLEFEDDVRNYLEFMRYHSHRMPYPDDGFEPRF